MKLPGEYELDLDKTARLKVGPTRDRFLTEAGFEQAVAQFSADNADVAARTSLSISLESLTMRTAEGEESLKVIKLTEKKGRTTLVVDWYGEEETFEVQDMGGGAIHLEAEANELSEYVWRKKK